MVILHVDLIFCPLKPEAGAFIQEYANDLLEMILLSRYFSIIFVSPPTLLFFPPPPFLSIPLLLFQYIILPTEFLPLSPLVSATQVKSVPGLHIYYSYLRFKSYKLENGLQKKHCSEPNIEAI